MAFSLWAVGIATGCAFYAFFVHLLSIPLCCLRQERPQQRRDGRRKQLHYGNDFILNKLILIQSIGIIKCVTGD